VVDALAGAVLATPGAHLLDRHSDADHNRTVLTFAGDPQAVSAAVFAAARVAVERIDLTQHQGVHPRMGAVDVVPFVPMRSTALPDAAEVARGLGQRVAAELQVPVYLYGAATGLGRSPELRAYRGDGFESLLALGDRLPAPDFGPHRLHPTAGAVAVGARPPLVAFNVMLASGDLDVARRLARQLRESSGGMPGVQALGLWLEAHRAAQVSMNLLDPAHTTLAAVLAALRAGAHALSVELASAELVGLVPVAALAGLEGDPLPGLPGPGDTIESRLAAAGL
jgi:glutamate formiminotransferase